MNTALVRRAVKVAGAIHDETCERTSPVVEVQALQHFLLPAPARFRRQLEHRSPAVSATMARRAVEVADAIDD